MKHFFLILSLLLLLFTVTVSSHSGRTDSNGGHWDRKEGTYHYHSGEHAGENSSGSSSETANDIEPEVNIVETDTSEEEEKEETSEEVIVMKKETSTKEESSTEKESSTGIDSKTIIIIVAIVVGGVVLFLIARQVIKHYSADEFFGTLFFIVLIIVGVIILRGCKNSETYDNHIENCDGTCAHIKEHCEDYSSQIDDLEQELEEENFYYLKCNECEISIENCDYVETDYDEHLCISCAFYEGYRKCRGCEIYFKSDTALDSTAYYCCSCSYDDNNAFGCCFCGVGPLDYDKLVKFMVGETPGYMCVYCCENYFSNVDTMTPCYYCIECGEIFSGNYYLHYIYDETICYNCILEKDFKKCSLCNKYYDEGENGICGFCLEKQLDE